MNDKEDVEQRQWKWRK